MCFQIMTTLSKCEHVCVVFCSFIPCVDSVPGKLKQFIDDLHSGKLHRDFHNAPQMVCPFN